ncbi:MAG: hypothetical protein V8T87_03100 [Victivallales bacterium]
MFNASRSIPKQAPAVERVRRRSANHDPPRQEEPCQQGKADEAGSS